MSITSSIINEWRLCDDNILLLRMIIKVVFYNDINIVYNMKTSASDLMIN
jgi:hypothetical protein